MTVRLRSLLLSGAVLAALPGLAGMPEARADEKPHLVTFGPRAQQFEGDHDFKQFVHISVPEETGPLFLRVFDADIGGAHDEPLRGFNTETRFSLYGDGGVPRFFRDEEGVVQEAIEGEPLGAVTYGADQAVDGQWVTLFPLNAAQGAADGNRRSFVLAVEGVSGDDGNVFEVAISRSDADNRDPGDVRIYSYAPTFQIAEEGENAELRFTVPEGADSLVIENFDTAEAAIFYAGQFFSAPLTASEKSKWQRDRLSLRPGEQGRKASVIVSGGAESPNDATVVVNLPGEAGDADRPVAIDLPVRITQANKRPYALFEISQLACGEMLFDASRSFDTDGDGLSYRWYFDGADEANDGNAVVRFSRGGKHRGRLELFDSSGVVANGRAVDFSFDVKLPPIAAFEVPGLVAQNAPVRFDGSASRTQPADGQIQTFQWRFGNGAELVQELADDAFGRPVYQFPEFGTYSVELTVTDSDGPCNSDTVAKMVTVNAPPVADGGGDRDVLTGEILQFDGSASTDPDGSIASYWWDFGDERRVFGPTAQHSFHEPGVYQVRLSVQDDTIFDTAADTDVITVTVRDPVNERPVARVGESRFVSIGETVTFDGSASSDGDGRLLFYLWDFGDGTGDDQPVVQHTYWEPGTYEVNLTVKDEREAENGQSVATMTITVIPADNRAPVLDFPTLLTTTLHEPVRFDALAANDRDGSIVSYQWDFGDGSKGSGPVIEHRYDAPGHYEGSLVLTDDGVPEPQRTRVDFSVVVSGRANSAPKAVAGADLTATAGEEIAFDGSASTDSDGSILSYVWDFDDGHGATGIKTRHIYQFPGRYQVTLKVTDDEPEALRLSGHDSLTVQVNPAPNGAPTAVAGILGDDWTVARGEIVRFDGSQSSDPDGNIMAYAWDFGNGGQSPDAKPVHAFHDTGTFDVRLIVTDDGDPVQTDEATVTITVVEGSDGRASE